MHLYFSVKEVKRREIQKKNEIKHQKEKQKKRQKKLQRRQSNFIVPKLGYKFELFKLNSKSLPLFVFPENRRRISKAQAIEVKR